MVTRISSSPPWAWSTGPYNRTSWGSWSSGSKDWLHWKRGSTIFGMRLRCNWRNRSCRCRGGNQKRDYLLSEMGGNVKTALEKKKAPREQKRLREKEAVVEVS